MKLLFDYSEQISPLTLKIKDRNKEKAYQIYVASTVQWFRIALILGIVMFYSFMIVDYYIFNELLLDFLKIRFFVVTPFLVISFILTYWKRYPEFAQIINLTAVTIGGAGIIVMAIVGHEHPEISRNFSGLIPFFLYIYAFLRIRYIYGAVAGSALLTGYALAEYFILKTPFSIFVANVFYMSASNMAGISVAYLLEYQGKREFLLHERVSEFSIKDSMTSLYNRHYFNNVCTKDIEDFIVLAEGKIGEDKRNKDVAMNTYGMVMLDIDHFKRVNDQYGHDEGDEILKAFAFILKENVRSTDDVLRWGGEEFLIILKYAQKEYLTEFVKKIGKAIQDNKFTLKNGEFIPVRSSIGVVSIPIEGYDSIDELIKLADNAMYQAKNTGRNKGFEALTDDKGNIIYKEIIWD